MAFTEEDRAKMDKAAEEARKELEQLTAKYPDASQEFGGWFKKFVPSAGHKRLGRIMTELA